jgi:predicted DNA-binding transcriptional regulator YafY
MLETSARLFRLLSLLQSKPHWPGPELARRLGVSTRTVRNDIECLRQLGYPVDARHGSAGGYRLSAGANMPPLLFDDDEAVATTIALATVGTSQMAGMDESAQRALAKLEQVIPSHVRAKVAALRTATEVPVPSTRGADPAIVDAETLTAVAMAIQEHEWLRFSYTRFSANGSAEEAAKRRVEPYRLVSWRGRWYLVAFDLERDDWRTFRLDRMHPSARTFRPFTPRELPADASTLVLRGVAGAGWRVHARIVVHAPAEEVLARIDPTVGVVEILDEHTSALATGADSYETIAVYIGMLGLDFTVADPPELVAHIDLLAGRYRAAVESMTP